MCAKIVAVRNDRLGGRLGAMLNAIRVATDYDTSFSFTWADHADVSPELQKPQELFSERFIADHRETKRSYGDLQRDLKAIENFRDPLAKDQFSNIKISEIDYKISEAMTPVVMPWEDSSTVRAALATSLLHIQFSEAVAQAILKIEAEFSGSSLTAYHLRRGDIIDPNARPSNVLWPNKYVPSVFYEKHIKRTISRDQKSKILIFSDAEHELNAFCEISPNIVRADRFLSDLNLTQLQNDFMELYLMSRCKTIVAPGASAFSGVAALIGNCSIVNVREDLTNAERDDSLNELTERIFSSPERFAGDADLGQNFPELIQHHRKVGSPEVAFNIIKNHMTRGFNYSYIYDLLAEESFYLEDFETSRQILNLLKKRPIRTNLANAQTYAWSGLTAFSQGLFYEAARLHHIANWLQPLLPINRVLYGLVTAHLDPNSSNSYPLPKDLVVMRRSGVPKFLDIHKVIRAQLDELRGRDCGEGVYEFIPFELDVRDWKEICSTSLPAAFWNIPNQRKIINFYKSTYRSKIENPPIKSLLGQLYLQAGFESEGTLFVETAASDDPSNHFALIRLARLRLLQDKFNESERLYELAADLSGGNIFFQSELALTKMKLGKKSEAIDILLNLEKCPHDVIEIILLSADILRRSPKTIDLAYNLAVRADGLAPGALRTTQLLRKVLEKMGKTDEAEQLSLRLQGWNRKPGRFSSRIDRIQPAASL